MKKIFISFIFLVFALTTAFAQNSFQASFNYTGNKLSFYLKPNASFSSGFSTIEFFVRYPTSSPAFTYSALTVNTTNFPGMQSSGAVGSGQWEIERNNPAYLLAGFNTDHFIYTSPALVSTVTPYVAGQEYEVFNVTLSANPATLGLTLIHQDDESSYYLAITGENGNELRPASLGNYFFPSTATSAGPAGSTFYFIPLAAAPVPVRFANFSANKRNDNALLNWAVENESAITDRYEIERSLNGTNFSKVATVQAKNNGSSTNTYDLTDLNLSTLRANGGVIYYRIKQIDKDGVSVYTEIRSVRLDGKGIALAVYPNPVKNNANISLDLVQDAEVIITVNDAAGKQVQHTQMQGFKGLNVKSINMSALAAGSYMLKVQAGTDIKTVPVVKAN